MEIIERDDYLFIVGDSRESPGAKFVVYIDEKTMTKVRMFVEVFRERFDYLIKMGKSPGTVYYWEENYHDKVVDFLKLMMPGSSIRDIGNALCALGL